MWKSFTFSRTVFSFSTGGRMVILSGKRTASAWTRHPGKGARCDPRSSVPLRPWGRGGVGQLQGRTGLPGPGPWLQPRHTWHLNHCSVPMHTLFTQVTLSKSNKPVAAIRPRILGHHGRRPAQQGCAELLQGTAVCVPRYVRLHSAGQAFQTSGRGARAVRTPGHSCPSTEFPRPPPTLPT